MKKTACFLAALFLIFGCSFHCFAVDKSGVYEVLKSYYSRYDLTDEEIELPLCQELSNGCTVFKYTILREDIYSAYPAWIRHFKIGDYVYIDGGGPTYFITDGNDFYEIQVAYEFQIIDDAVVAELAEIIPVDKAGHGIRRRTAKDDEYGYTYTSDQIRKIYGTSAIETGEHPEGYMLLTLSVTLLLALGIIRLKKSKS